MYANSFTSACFVASTISSEFRITILIPNKLQSIIGTILLWKEKKMVFFLFIFEKSEIIVLIDKIEETILLEKKILYSTFSYEQSSLSSKYCNFLSSLNLQL